MADSTEENFILMSAKETAVLLGIQGSTLRKYCKLLEEAGYNIHRNEQNYRGFFDKDIVLLRRLIAITKQPAMTLEQAISAVLSSINIDSMARTAMHEVTESPYITKQAFEEYQHKQEVFQKELLDQLSKQTKYISASLEKRDLTLMNSLKDLSKTKRLKIKENKKKWWHFW